MSTSFQRPLFHARTTFSALLIVIMASTANAQGPACDNCAEPCPLSIPGLWIYNPQQGYQILSFGFEANTCLYDESHCDTLIQCEPSRALDTVAADLALLEAEEQIIRYLKTSGADFKLVAERNAVVLYGCGGSVSAVIPVDAPITRTYSYHAPNAMRRVPIDMAPVQRNLARTVIVPTLF